MIAVVVVNAFAPFVPFVPAAPAAPAEPGIYVTVGVGHAQLQSDAALISTRIYTDPLARSMGFWQGGFNGENNEVRFQVRHQAGR
jgi:hypothetical protein